MRQGTVWSFETARFTVRLDIKRDRNHKYDGDDKDGETQANLDSGEYVAFDSRVTVDLDGEEIGVDYLGASVYSADNYADFWTSHRSSDPMNRNCSIMRARKGHDVSICHYFPSMVKEAVSSARAFLAKVPRMRERA